MNNSKTAKDQASTIAGEAIAGNTAKTSKFSKVKNWFSKLNIKFPKRKTTVFEKFIEGLAKVVRGAILFTALGYFIPEMRETLPSFYQITDAIVSIFEKLCSFLVNLF